MAKKVEIEQTEIEAPYELPEGWKWCRLGDVANKLVDGDHNPPKGLEKKTDYLMLSSRNINNNSIIDLDNVRYLSKETFDIENQRTRLETGDILFTSVGSLGRSCIFNGNYNLCFQRSVSVINTTQNNSFVKLYFDSPFYQNYVLEHATGTAQMGFYLKEMSNSPIPLPSTLAEQKRIVSRIETLFAKLDEAEEKTRTVLDGFETRKAAILHKAFTGQLTANWRKENGVSDDSWEEKTLEDVCIKEITDGTHKTPTYVDEKSGVPFISGKDVSNEFIDWSDLRYIPNELHNELYERLAPQIDDILLSKNGARLGKAAIVETDLVFDIYVTLALLRPNKDTILPRYLWRIINSPVIQSQIQEHLTGIGMPNLHLRDIKVMVIKVPSLCEQQEIVRILDTVLEKESSAKEATQTVLDHIAMLKKSILARAFRGKL